MHPQRIYFERIGQVLKPQTRWLDIGCGRRLVPWWLHGGDEIESALKSQPDLLVGIDPDLDALRDNVSCRFKLKADASRLPFERGSFDLITSNMVFEHVDDPESILVEVKRVLHPGGRLLIHTPNWLDIVTIMARIVPNSLHPVFVSRMEKRRAEDVYPTRFRFNRPQTIEKLLSDAGFSSWRIDLLDQPATYDHLPLIAGVESFWHRMARRWPALKGTLLIEAQS